MIVPAGHLSSRSVCFYAVEDNPVGWTGTARSGCPCVPRIAQPEETVEMALAEEVPVLETKRLRLRGFRPSDLDDYAAMSADIRVQRTIGDGAVWDRSRSGSGAQRDGLTLSWRGLSPFDRGEKAMPRKGPELRCASRLRMRNEIGSSA